MSESDESVSGCAFQVRLLAGGFLPKGLREPVNGREASESL